MYEKINYLILSVKFIPLFAGSKTPTSKFGECEEVRWWEITARKSPIGAGSSSVGDGQNPH
ncbi:hypothetical protein COI89_14250 [Bacillus cereus]|nr:hypothetical protein COI89_14250 [Bacillus cereus]